MRVSGFRRISALLLLFLLASQSDSFSVERRQVFVDLLATGTTASTVVFAVAPAQAVPIKEMDLTLPTYDDVKKSSASASNVKSLTIEKPIQGVIGGAAGGGRTTSKPREAVSSSVKPAAATTTTSKPRPLKTSMPKYDF